MRFQPGEPNNYGNKEDCIAIIKIYGGNLGDFSCGYSCAFICETNYESL